MSLLVGNRLQSAKSMEPDPEPQFSDSEPEPEQHRLIEIVIQSSSPESLNEPPPEIMHSFSSVQTIERANPNLLDEGQEVKKRQQKVNNAMEMLQQIREKQQQQREANKEVIARNKKKERERQAEKQLRKEFEHHQFLPISSLQKVKGLLQIFEETCPIQELPREEQPTSRLRQDNRRLLTRGMLLSIEELRTNSFKDHTEVQTQLLDATRDPLRYCYKLASEIEATFFRTLRKSWGKNEGYPKQIKLVLKEFNDRNNVEFRRNILNSRINHKQLAQADEQSLKCEKTKEQQRARVLQLVRESEKDFFGQANQQEPEEEPPQLTSFPSGPSFNSRMDLQQRGQDREQLKRKERNHLLQIFHACEQSLSHSYQKREERLRKLKSQHSNWPPFKEMCVRFQL